MPKQLSRKFYDPTITLEVPSEINCQGCITGNVTSDGVCPVEGADVFFSSSLPNSVSFDPNPAITDNNGEYSSMVTVAPPLSGTVITIIASTEVDNIPISTTEFTIVSCEIEAETVYVTNSLSNNVTAIDGQNNTPITTLPVQTLPQRVLVTPDGEFAYVANAASASVSVIRVSDNTLVGNPITTGGGSANLVATPDSRFVYVYNVEAKTVSVITVSDNPSVIKNIDVGEGTGGPIPFKNIAITPNGQFVYVANTPDSTVSVIQTSNNVVIKTIPVPNFPLSIASTPDSKFVYVVSSNGAITVIETSNQTIFDTIFNPAPNPQNLAITPNGEFLYVIGNSQFVEAFRISDNTRIANIELSRANFSLDIVISPLSDFVYVIANQNFLPFGSFNVIDVASNTVIKQVQLGVSPRQIAINTDGSRVYVSNADPDNVEVIQTSNNELIANIPAGGNGAQGIAVTP
ncbi:beta-propeller fold lactonase family protein [Chengkuizengella sediminis]|uniref:beta-propeller fold lactonase family protein n=1 Tax=Chengkuizengella sediminis TaxID=1885917 RepID=UPI001389B15B|nr:beta-propeller fold lactonase family protein [Chengkuizengella sediminis]NDI33223.1 beta-propeller fold lactonase family protein [Chengkuizengella sediminis]